MVDGYLEAWRWQPCDSFALNVFKRHYFPSELPVRPILSETCMENSLDKIVDLLECEKPISIARSF